MYAITLAASLLTAAFSPLAVASPSSTECTQRFRAIDDKADEDMRDAKELISLLEQEINDPAVISAFHDDLRLRLKAAETNRANILSKQHLDLNATRDQCNQQRGAEQERRAAEEVSP